MSLKTVNYGSFAARIIPVDYALYGKMIGKQDDGWLGHTVPDVFQLIENGRLWVLDVNKRIGGSEPLYRHLRLVGFDKHFFDCVQRVDG